MNREKELEIIRNNYNNGDRYTPKGYVFCYDEFGNLLFHKHNMIVKTGRKAIFATLTQPSASSIKLSDFKARLGNSTEIATENDNVNSIGSTKTNPIIPTVTSHNDDLIFEYVISYSRELANSLKDISSLGLVYVTDDNEKLFSRVVFPKYSSTATLTFRYYLYF